MGSGTDTVDDNEGQNLISFGVGFEKENMTGHRTNWNDLTITFTGTKDQLVIQGYFASEDNRNYDVIFADGSKFEYNNPENPINKVYESEQ